MWEDVSATYADRRDPTGSDADLIDDLLAELPPNPDVLDVGCGDGARTLANLPTGSVGLDISRAGVEMATDRVPDARLAHGDMANLPFAADTFDGITAYHAVFHVPLDEQPAVYREFARVLRPGGRLLATVPGGRFETVRSGWMNGRMYFASPGTGEIRQSLTDAGFRDVQTVTADDPLGSSSQFLFATRE